MGEFWKGTYNGAQTYLRNHNNNEAEWKEDKSWLDWNTTWK